MPRPEGLVTLLSVNDTGVPLARLAAVRVRYGTPLVVATRVKPIAPVWAESVEAVVERPVGTTQVLDAVVQY